MLAPPDSNNTKELSGPAKVVVDFRLTYDGRITDMKIQENEAGEILGMLCQSDPQSGSLSALAGADAPDHCEQLARDPVHLYYN